MKKFLALSLALAVTVAIAASASAQMKFKDVPDSHWAASAVYDLVKLGVTKGYPDGTFRGTKQITRYETAILISKLAQAVGSDSAVQSDIAALKREVAMIKRSPAGGSPLSGAYMASWKACNLLAEKGSVRGSVMSYRLKLTSAQELGEGANVKLTLDTMDYGFYDDGSTATGGILATQLLDVESNLKLNMAALGLADPVDLKVTFGPGPKVHAADPAGTIPSEVGLTYVRPRTGVMASTKLWGASVSGGYTALTLPASGRVQMSDISGQIGYEFQGVPLVESLQLGVTGQYISAGQFSSNDRDLRGAITMGAPLGDKIEVGGTLGMGGSDQKAWMVAGSMALNDVWDTGTVAVVRASKIGSQFIDGRAAFAAAEFDQAGYDSFDRLLTAGTVNLGGELVQSVTDDLKLVGKGDLRLQSDYKYEAPNGRLTAQGGIQYLVAPNTTVDAMYRISQDKGLADTTDVAAVGLMYQF